MADADIVISWFADVPTAVRAAFVRPTKFISLPIPSSRKYGAAIQALGQNPIAAAISKYAPGTTAMRVALVGFSEGCAGVGGLLSTADGGRVDAVLAIDGIHAGLNYNALKPWFEFAKKALVDITLFVDSYSSVVPPGYPSTTQTADWIWENLNLGAPHISPPLPPLVVEPTSIKSNALPGVPSKIVEYPTIPWKMQRRDHGVVMLGLKNNHAAGVADHQYQAKVMLPLCVRAFLADRWNTLDPAQGQV